MKIIIVDYDMGNIAALRNAIEYLNYNEETGRPIFNVEFIYNNIDNNGIPLHSANISPNQKLQLHIDALTDMYLLYKSDVFIKSKKTSWTNFISFWRDRRPSRGDALTGLFD